MMSGSETVPYEDSFLLVGGSVLFKGGSRHIFEYGKGGAEMWNHHYEGVQLDAVADKGVPVLLKKEMLPECEEDEYDD